MGAGDIYYIALADLYKPSVDILRSPREDIIVFFYFVPSNYYFEFLRINISFP